MTYVVISPKEGKLYKKCIKLYQFIISILETSGDFLFFIVAEQMTAFAWWASTICGFPYLLPAPILIW